MDFFINALVSWKTTILGIAAVTGVIAKWASAGVIDFNDIPVLLAGVAPFGRRHANIPIVFDAKAERAETIGHARNADRRRPHIHAAPASAEVHRHPHHADHLGFGLHLRSPE